MSYYRQWKPYVPVAQRQANAERQISRLGRNGKIEPVRIKGRTIVSSFWGKGWCAHLEKHSDFDNRLPRGRSYVRSGAVCHLEVKAGRIDAQVVGSSLYEVAIDIRVLKPTDWEALKQKCSGEIGSLLELLQGKLSNRVMNIVTDRDAGLFPNPGEMKFSCSCPDWAAMCKHVAAVLYGVGNRLEGHPALLFTLRGVDASELIAAGLNATQGAATASPNLLAEESLSGIFDIDFDDGSADTVSKPKAGGAPRQGRRAAAPSAKKRPRAEPISKRPTPFRPSARSIARLRRQSGLSIADFAKRLKVSTATVNRWEAANGPLTLQARCLTALQRLHRDQRG
jgi:uncharacterized Zn finger protein